MNDLTIPARNPVTVILPTSIDEIWRIARMAVMGNMAPESLTKGKGDDEAASACCIAIMAGAELGLTPLMALRSYAVVNGRPSLWGDGLKAVVRQSGRAKFIRAGSDLEHGWCESERVDTGEFSRKEFTMVQARKAGLAGKAGPWQQYPDKMMERRAISLCLNDLYADILGGVVGAEEAMDSSPSSSPPTTVSPARSAPSAPPVSAPVSDLQADADFIDAVVNEPATAETKEPEAEQTDALPPVKEVAAAGAPAPTKLLNPGTASLFLEQIEGALVLTRNVDDLEDAWNEADPEGTFDRDDFHLGAAFKIKHFHIARVEALAKPVTTATLRAPSPPSGQGSLLEAGQ